MRYDYKSQPKQDVPACPVCGTGNPPVSYIDRYGYRVGLSRCVCGFGYLNPQLTAEAYAVFYRDWYRQVIAKHEQRAHDFDRMQGKQLGYGRALARACPEVPCGGQLLDAGGSTGAVAEGFTESQHPASKVTVLDPSAAELAYAAQRGYQTVEGTLEGLIWEGDPIYDVILCAQTLDHVQDPVKALTHLREAIRPGGWLLLDYVACDEGIPQLARKIDHPCYWTRASVTRALAQTGWTPGRFMGPELFGATKKGLLVCRSTS